MAGFGKRVFSNRLAALRNGRGRSQEDLARESGVSLNAIARYEAERSTARRSRRRSSSPRRWAASLDVPSGRVGFAVGTVR